MRSDSAPRFPADRLLSALGAVPANAWAEPATEADEVNPGYQFASLIVSRRRKPAADLFRFVLVEFEPVWTAWISRVPPGGFIGPHIDEGCPYRERWQVPIVAAGSLNGEPAETGVAFRVWHWEPHSVTNPTGVPRVHLVIDREALAGVPDAPFQRIEVP